MTASELTTMSLAHRILESVDQQEDKNSLPSSSANLLLKENGIVKELLLN